MKKDLADLSSCYLFHSHFALYLILSCFLSFSFFILFILSLILFVYLWFTGSLCVCLHYLLLFLAILFPFFCLLVLSCSLISSFSFIVCLFCQSCLTSFLSPTQTEAGRIGLEGCMCEDYYRIRELLYQQYAVV